MSPQKSIGSHDGKAKGFQSGMMCVGHVVQGAWNVAFKEAEQTAPHGSGNGSMSRTETGQEPC